MTQGQSAYTQFKQERFAPILTQSLRISKADRVAHFPYYHVDLNAGSGYNHKAQVQGSPLNFLSAVDRNQRENFYGFFVDNDFACVSELIQRPEIVARAERVTLFHADNAEILPVVAEFVAGRERPHFAMGSILVDPNGYHTGVPWDELRQFCLAHPRFDLILNLNVRQFKLEQAWILRKCGRWAARRLQPISEFPLWFQRPNWMLTDICSMGGNLWVQLVGRTMRTHSTDYQSLGFYDYVSPRGRSIIDRIEKKQSDSSPPQLPFL